MTKRLGAAEQAQQGITEYIRAHSLESGQALPTESSLCEELGLSRSSVREAMRTLASLDIVEVRHGHGTYVGSMSLAPLVRGMVLRTTLDARRSLHRLEEVIDTRQAIDLAIAEELVDAFQAKEADGLKKLVEDMRAAHAAGKSFATQDRAFHQEIMSHIGNSFIRELSDAFWQIHMEVLPLVSIHMPEDVDLTIEAHADIIKALEAGDTRRYKDVVIEHYAPLRRSIINSESAR